MLILSRRSGEQLKIGDNITLTILEISGDKVRIAINAPKDIKILRSELLEASEINIEAANLSKEALGALKDLLMTPENE